MAWDRLWHFVSHRPGLSASVIEWKACLGEAAWHGFRGRYLIGAGVATICRRPADGSVLRVVPMADGRYSLVSEASGAVEQCGLAEAEVVNYRLDVSALRSTVAEALGLHLEPGSITELPGAFGLGTWEPMTGTHVPAFMMLPPTSRLLIYEIRRLCTDYMSGFVLFVPEPPQLGASAREALERARGFVVPLNETLAGDETGELIASSGWPTYRSAYCGRYLTSRMVPAQPPYQFARRGMWALRFEGQELFLDGSLKGPEFLHYLIRHQGHEVHVVAMLADVAGSTRSLINPAAEGLAQLSSSGSDVVDSNTVAQCRMRYEELKQELAAAQADSDLARTDRAKNEINQMARYLSSSIGLGGRSRKTNDDVTKIRRRIARVIDTAIDKIHEGHPSLAAHLRNSVKTSTSMSYAPDRPIDWTLE